MPSLRWNQIKGRAVVVDQPFYTTYLAATSSVPCTPRRNDSNCAFRLLSTVNMWSSDDCPVNLSQRPPSPRVPSWPAWENGPCPGRWMDNHNGLSKELKKLRQRALCFSEVERTWSCMRQVWQPYKSLHATSLHMSAQAPQALRQQPATKLNHFSRYGFVGSKPGMPSLLESFLTRWWKMIKPINYQSWSSPLLRLRKLAHDHRCESPRQSLARPQPPRESICSASWQLHRFQSLAFALSHKARALSMGKIWSSRVRYL